MLPFILQLLLSNYRDWCAKHNKKFSADFDIKARVEEVLNECGMAQNRARSMEQEDFIKLLVAFNKAGIHFC